MCVCVCIHTYIYICTLFVKYMIEKVSQEYTKLDFKKGIWSISKKLGGKCQT